MPNHAPTANSVVAFANGPFLDDTGLFRGLALRLPGTPLDPYERACLRVRVLAAVERTLTCDTRAFASWKMYRTAIAVPLGLDDHQLDSITPSWKPEYGAWFATTHATAKAQLARGQLGACREYLSRYERLHPAVRHNVPNFEEGRRAVVADAVHDAEQRANRGLDINWGVLRALGVETIAPPGAPPGEDLAHDNLLARFYSGASLLAARWFVHDYPDALGRVLDIGGATAQTPDSERVWIINRARPIGDPYRAVGRAAPSFTSLNTALGLLERTYYLPCVYDAAIAALGQPQMLAPLGAFLSTASVSTVVQLADHTRDVRNDAGRAIADELAARCDATCDRLGKKSVLAWQIQHALAHHVPPRRPKRELPTVDKKAVAQADAWIGRGIAFLTPMLADIERLRGLMKGGGNDAEHRAVLQRLLEQMGNALDTLTATRPLSEDDALVATLAIDFSAYPKEAGARGGVVERVRHMAAKGMRLTNGQILDELRAIVALEEGRSGFDFGEQAVTSSQVRSRVRDNEVLHELGHAWEFSREDLMAAANAWVKRHALSATTYRIAELQTVAILAGNAPDVSHESLLRRFCETADESTRLDSREALQTMFRGMGLDAAIGSLDVTRITNAREPFADDEVALPLVGDPYLGKTYENGATELVAKGLESLASPGHALIALLAGPVDALAFVLGAILETC